MQKEFQRAYLSLGGCWRKLYSSSFRVFRSHGRCPSYIQASYATGLRAGTSSPRARISGRLDEITRDYLAELADALITDNNVRKRPGMEAMIGRLLHLMRGTARFVGTTSRRGARRQSKFQPQRVHDGYLRAERATSGRTRESGIGMF